MSKFVAITDTAVTCASNAAVGVLSVISGNTKRVLIKEIGISFDGTDATKTPIRVDFVRAETDGTGTTGVIRREDESNAETPIATCKYSYAAGAQPTVNVEMLRSWYVTPAGGLWVMQFPLGEELVIAGTTNVGWIRATTITASGTPSCLAYISFAE